MSQSLLPEPVSLSGPVPPPLPHIPKRYVQSRMVGQTWEILGVVNDSNGFAWICVRHTSPNGDVVDGCIDRNSYFNGTTGIRLYSWDTPIDPWVSSKGSRHNKLARFAEVYARMGYNPWFLDTVSDILDDPSFIQIGKDFKVITRVREIPEHLKPSQYSRNTNPKCWKMTRTGVELLRKKEML